MLTETGICNLQGTKFYQMAIARGVTNRINYKRKRLHEIIVLVHLLSQSYDIP